VSEREIFSKIAREGGTFETRVTRKYQGRKPYEKQDPRIIKAVIPGLVAAIETEVGNTVKQGDTMIILEAMKMLNRIKAQTNGTIKVIRVAPGEKVAKGQVLIEIE
jgi:biotin carboxyl carrier protein